MVTKTANRILDYIRINSGTTHDGLISCGLGLSVVTVKRYTKALQAAGYIELAWDGIAWTLSDRGRKAFEMNALFERQFPGRAAAPVIGGGLSWSGEAS